MKRDRTTRHWWWPWKSRIQEIDRSIWHVLKKADKTWVVHRIHEFLDDEYQINKIQINLSSRMYSKRWCSCRDRINDENSHQSLASLVRNTCWILYFESDTKIQKIPSKKLSKKDWTTGWIPVFSSREHHFEIRRVGHDCRPCRFKFNISRCVKARDCPWS